MIPFLDLQAQYESIQDEILAAVTHTLSSTQWILGDAVAAFEEEFAQFTDTDMGIGVNSGTSALHLALLAAGVGPDDEVITVAGTFVATVAAIEYTGARPVFVEIDSLTLNMDPNLVEAAITPRTKAVLPVHLHGRPADLDQILELADRHDLIVIEDAAQAHGAEYKGRRIGSIGHMGCFSFYPGKNLGACGEGGMVVTNNPEYAQKIRMLRDWGQERKYQHVLKGFNYRMDGVQAAILRVKLRHLEAWTEKRRELAKHYSELLDSANVMLPDEQADMRHVYHVYAVRVPQRDSIRSALRSRGIDTGIHYPIPVHLQKAYEDLGYNHGDLPITEIAAEELLSLPMFPEMSKSQVAEVCDALREEIQAVSATR